MYKPSHSQSAARVRIAASIARFEPAGCSRKIQGLPIALPQREVIAGLAGSRAGRGRSAVARQVLPAKQRGVARVALKYPGGYRII